MLKTNDPFDKRTTDRFENRQLNATRKPEDRGRQGFTFRSGPRDI